MNLLRYRPVVRTVRVGGRKVKVMIADNQRVQEVEDGDVQHATVKPQTIGVKTKFQADADTGLWVPLPEDVERARAERRARRARDTQ